MAKVELKKPIVDEIKGYVTDAKAAVLVDYRGLTVEQDTQLRKKLREAGVVYKVFKNTYLKRAFEGTAYAELDKHLEGPTAVAFGMEDATAPARVLAEFAKTADKLELKELTTIKKEFKLLLQFLQEKLLFPNYLEVCNLLLQILLVLLNRFQKKMAKQHNCC